jgi:D-threonate/D-erythronate kinase
MIGVIADDLTGAAEIGAVGLRHGLRAEIVRRGQPGGWADLVCMDTDSRACEPGEAAKRAAAAAKLLRAAGAKWIYKKVDSVLRGQVTAEVEAVMKQLDLQRALLLPANPSLGRTIRGGHYFLRGRPLHKTEFAQDPHFPRRSSQVLRLVKAPDQFFMRAVNGGHRLMDGNIVIGDAETAADVQGWTASWDARMLPAGGSEFFNALLNVESPARADGSGPGPENSPGHELFVIGTSTQSARKFIAAQRRKKTPVFSLPQELAWGAEFTPAAVAAVTQRVVAALASSPRVILNVGLPPVRDAAAAGRLSENVVRVAGRVLRRLRVARVFAEGGATAAELVRCMGWARLEVLRELAPGVAVLAVAGEKNLLLTIKPGTYAWPAKWT